MLKQKNTGLLSFAPFKKNNGQKTVVFDLLIFYNMIAMSPPDPSLMILSNVSFNL
jgi:hypothetical protein